MKAIIHATLLSMTLAATCVADFTRWAEFDSVDGFVTAAMEFKPDDAGSDLAHLFTVRELGQPEDPKTGTPVPAVAIGSATTLWADDSRALVFVTAAPPTQATHSRVGVLFLLVRQHESWGIGDYRRFIATGQHAEVEAELTSGTGTGYQLGADGMMPVATIRASHGGRGYGYQVSASYTFRGDQIRRYDLE